MATRQLKSGRPSLSRIAAGGRQPFDSMVIVQGEADLLEVVGTHGPSASRASRADRGHDERRREEAAGHPENNPRDRHPPALEPTLALSDVDQRSPAEEDRRQAAEAREEEEDAQREARDRLAAGDSRLRPRYP